jgi:hypothetical protein
MSALESPHSLSVSSIAESGQPTFMNTAHHPPALDDAILVVTAPPPSFDFGIDCMNYDTGPEFRGILWIIILMKSNMLISV